MRAGSRVLRGALVLAFTACGTDGGSGWVVPSPPAGTAGEEIRILGVVRHSRIEGGVWVLRGADSVTYEPSNLPTRFQVEGLSVEAFARQRDDLAGIHQVGPIVDLERIRTR